LIALDFDPFRLSQFVDRVVLDLVEDDCGVKGDKTGSGQQQAQGGGKGFAEKSLVR
jgi:hypothetical protein